MRRSTQKIASLFIILLAALLAFPGLFSVHRNQVSAYVQDASRSDIKSKVKSPKQTPKIIKGDAPANDNCANAVAITSCPFSDTRSTAGATEETGEPQPCAPIEATVWYAYTNASGNSVILTVALCDSDFDAVLGVYRVDGGPCVFASFTAVACNDDTFNCGSGVQPVVTFIAEPGATYKIQAGGFFGETGTLAISVDCQEIGCAPAVISGTLGSGDPNFTGRQSSGMQLGRLTRDAVTSTCAAPKACHIVDPEGLRAFDAYQFPNDSSKDACVLINLKVVDQTDCNLQSNAYLDTFDPNNICASYLGDPGFSSGSNPPSPTNFTVVVPAGHTLIVVVQTTNFGETGCHYTLTVAGNLCFDTCVQDDRNPSRFILFSKSNGDYEYHDCSKGIVLKGRGVVSPPSPPGNCKLFLDDSGSVPKRPDRAVHLEVNVCTFVASATIRFPLTAKTATVLSDSNYTNNDCVCH
jgi:hypothetical protein